MLAFISGVNNMKRLKTATLVANVDESSHSQIVKSMGLPPCPPPVAMGQPEVPSGRAILGKTSLSNQATFIRIHSSFANTVA